jgi:hypothetical protein
LDQPAQTDKNLAAVAANGRAVVTGVGTVLAFSVAENIVDIVPFFGFFSGLISTLGSMIALSALLIGFGAVLLTRGGRQAEYYGGGDPFDDEPAWEENGFYGEAGEAEEVRSQTEAESASEDATKSEDMAEATADVDDDLNNDAGDTGDTEGE